MWRIVSLLSVLIGALCPAAEGKPLLHVNKTEQQHLNVRLTVPVNSSSDSLYIRLIRNESGNRIYLYDSKKLPDPYIDDRFKGRLQYDFKLVRNGTIECLLSDLKVNDSGQYEWIVGSKGRKNIIKLKLEVRARKNGQDTSHSNVTAEDVKTTQRGRIEMYAAVSLFVVVLVYLIIKFCNYHPDDPPSKI